METINIYNENLEEKKITIDCDTNILIFNNCLKTLDINVLDNVKVEINDFNNTQSEKTHINLNIGNDSELTYNLSNIVNQNYQLKINIAYNGSNSKVKANIHSIVKGTEYIDLNGIVKNENKNNELLENIKVLLKESGKCEVKPDMLINTREVKANHLVAISKIRDESLNYLMSKGISKKLSEDLIYKSFILSNIKNEELKNNIKEIL